MNLDDYLSSMGFLCMAHVGIGQPLQVNRFAPRWDRLDLDLWKQDLQRLHSHIDEARSSVPWDPRFEILWMVAKSISHHLRNLFFPFFFLLFFLFLMSPQRKYQQTLWLQPWFQSGAKWISSIHSTVSSRELVDLSSELERPFFALSSGDAASHLGVLLN